MFDPIKKLFNNKESHKKKSLVFTHIPKCGGTSFRLLIYNSAITCNIDEQEMHIPGTANCKNDYNLNQLDIDQLHSLQKRKLRILACHCSHNAHNDYQLQLETPYYFVILRDPVKRFISHYNFFNYRHGNNDCKNITLNELSEKKLNTFLKSWGNLQIKYVVGQKLAKQTARKDLLKIAKNHINKKYDSFYLLESTENISTSLNKSLPDWLTLKEEGLPTKNTNKTSYEINPEIMEKITAAHEEDILFYNYCKDLQVP